MRFVQVRRDVKVGCPYELLEVLKFHELVIENDVLVDLVLLGKNLETESVSFSMLPQLVRMRGAKDDIDNLGELGHNARQGIEHVFNALVRGKQAEGEQNYLSLHSELVLEISRIDETYVRNAVRDDIDFGGWRVIDVLQ